MNKFVLIALGLLAVANANDNNCIATKCGTVEGDGNCASRADGVITIDPCPSDQYCNITAGWMVALKTNATGTWKCANDPTTNNTGNTTKVKVAAGLFCSEDDDCYSGSCSDSKCQGLDVGETCIKTTKFNPSDDEKATYCGKNNYCSDDLKCVKGAGEGEDCSAAVPCADNAWCTQSKCRGKESLDEGAVCNQSWQCKTDLLCYGARCRASNEYTSGSYLAPCGVNADCAPTTCTCVGPANPDGKGRCSALAGGYRGKAYYNEERSNFPDEQECPLDRIGCSSWDWTYEVEAMNDEDCYDDFEIFGNVSLTSANNSTGLFFSAFALIAYFLY